MYNNENNNELRSLYEHNMHNKFLITVTSSTATKNGATRSKNPWDVKGE